MKRTIQIFLLLCGLGLGAQQAYVAPQPSDGNYILSRTYQARPLSATNQVQYADDVVETIQYVDGLGREQQAIGVGQSPNGADMVTPYRYDEYGRMDREWLSFPSTEYGRAAYKPGSTLDAQQYYQGNYASDFTVTATNQVNAYSEKEFEQSPLNRVLKQGAPGTPWAIGEGNEIEFAYNVNQAADAVKRFSVNVVESTADNVVIFSPSLSDDGQYPVGELNKVITYDENHDQGDKDHSTEEYTDKNGRVLLKRTYEGEVPHDTYYVYDDFGNLSFVLPPKMDAGSESLANINAALDDLGYQYTYDHRNRLVTKKLPGKAEEYIIYNTLDQPILTQDANLRDDNQWLFTKYDAFGRVAITGKMTRNLNRTQMQDEVNASPLTPWVTQQRDGTNVGQGGAVIYYDAQAYPGVDVFVDEVLTINYYDTYEPEYLPAGAPASVTLLGSGLTNSTEVQGLPIVSRVRVLDVSPAQWINTVTYYDDKGRAVHTYSDNEYLGTVDVVQSQLDFAGRVLKTRTAHTRNGNTITTIDNFTYDHVGRLLSQTQCISDETLGDDCSEGGSSVPVDPVYQDLTISDERVATQSITIRPTTTITGTATLRIDPNATGGGQPSEEELIVFNDYDEIGQLVQKKVGGAPESTYAATTGLQTVDYGYNVRGWLKNINDTDNLGSDLFAFGINYNTVEHSGTALFNGNIAETEWRSANDNVQRWYRYSYDALNRITMAFEKNNEYTLSLVEYDKNGNIQRLARRGVINAGGTINSMDNLTYHYDAGNRLLKVDEINTKYFGFKSSYSGTDDHYAYDANGNMTQDLNKGIKGATAAEDGIEYNHLNLPTLVRVDNGADIGTISFVYDAKGTKLEKIALGTSGGSPLNTTTLYAGNYIYENGQLQFFNHSEGYINASGSGYDYVYQYKDHLDNVRLAYSDIDDDGNINLNTEILNEKNYYPFGLEHKGYNNVISPNANNVAERWGFADKEYQQELSLNWHDITARNYQSDLGRWMNIDPLSEQYYQYSAYNYTLNNPVKLKDEDGNIVRDPNGNIVFTGSGSYATQRNVSKTTDAKGNTTYTVIDREYEQGNIYADNGTAVEAFSLVSASQRTVTIDKNGKLLTDTTTSVDQSKYDCTADCHGLTFGDNKIWINDDQVQTILNNDDRYLSVDIEGLAGIAVFKKNNGKIVHSAVRNSEGSFDDNAGFLKTEYGRTLAEASRGLTNGNLNVANSNNGYKGNVNFFFKGGFDRVLKDKRVNSLGTEKNGIRKITDKKEIAEFLTILNGN